MEAIVQLQVYGLSLHVYLHTYIGTYVVTCALDISFLVAIDPDYDISDGPKSSTYRFDHGKYALRACSTSRAYLR